jgi:type I restriction enzyme S subunit
MKLPVENYEFPRDWKVSPISDVAVFSRGVSWAKAEEAAEREGLLVISIPNIKDGWIDYNSKFNHYLAKEVTAAKRLNIGDIVFVGSSGSIHNVGRNARVSSLPIGSIAFASFTFKATPKAQEIDGEFFYYLVNSDLVPFPSFCKRAADGKFNFQLRDFANRLAVPLPPLPEQKKIAHILSTVQRAIEAQERIVQTTTELKKALMHKLFTEGLRGEPHKETELGLIPESWEVIPLGEFFQVKHGFAFDGEFFKPSGDYILMTPGHFHEEGGFRDQREKTKFFTGDIPQDYVLAKDDLVVAMTEQKSGLLGSAAFVPEGNRYLHNQRLGLIVDLDTEGLSKQFLFHIFNLPYLRVEVAKTSTGSKVKHTSPTKLRAVKVGIPPRVEEQEEIASALSACQQKINLAANRKAQLQDLFRTLLHELMTAKTRVHVLELPETAN